MVSIVTAGSAAIYHSPDDQQFIGWVHSLICESNVSEHVDIPVEVIHAWRDPQGENVTSSASRKISSVYKVEKKFQSSLILNTTRPRDTGNFYCLVEVKPISYDYAKKSDSANAMAFINPS